MRFSLPVAGRVRIHGGPLTMTFWLIMMICYWTMLFAVYATYYTFVVFGKIAVGLSVFVSRQIATYRARTP